MAQINGNNVLLTHNGATIACSTSNGLSISKELIDITTKCSSSWAENISGRKSWTIDIEGVYDTSLSENFDELFADMNGTTASTIRITDGSTPVASGDNSYHGSGFITELSLSAPMDDRVSWTATFVGNGALTNASVT